MEDPERGRLARQNTVVLSGEVGLSERFSLQGSLPLRAVRISAEEELSAEGMGDLELTMRTSLTDPERSPRFSALAYYGAALPTGKDPDATILQENAQLSRGVVSAIVGGEISHKIGERSQIYGRAESQIPIGTEGAGAELGYRFAPVRSATALLSSAFGASRHRWLAGLDFRYAGRDRMNPPHDGRGAFTVDNRGGHQTRLMGGLLFALTDKQNLGLLVGRLVEGDLSGDQLVARTELVLGWQGTFGAHRHPTKN